MTHGVTTKNTTQGIWTTRALLSPGVFPAAIENLEMQACRGLSGRLNAQVGNKMLWPPDCHAKKVDILYECLRLLTVESVTPI